MTCGSWAERTRFELVVGLLLRQFSKLVVSATHPPLHGGFEPIASAKLGSFFELCKFLAKNFQKSWKCDFSNVKRKRNNVNFYLVNGLNSSTNNIFAAKSL